jgi:hypothetical protein
MAVAEVVSLNSPKTEWDRGVQEDTIFMLEDWLARAKEGRFDGVAICGVLKSGEVETNVAQHNQHPALVVAVTILQARLQRLVEPIVAD